MKSLVAWVVLSMHCVCFIEMYDTHVYCTDLYCTDLYCTDLYCTDLYCTELYCTDLYCTELYCTDLYCTECIVHIWIVLPVIGHGKDIQPRIFELIRLLFKPGFA